MLRARIDRGVNVWPRTVIDGTSAGAVPWARPTRPAISAHARSVAAGLIAQGKGIERIARDDGDILPAVDGVGHRAVDDLPAEAGLPQHVATAGVERVEVAFAPSREQQIGGGGENAAIGDVVLREGPLPLQGLRIER